MEHQNCSLYRCSFVQGDYKTSILVAATPKTVEPRSEEILQGLIDRGIVAKTGNWRLEKKEELYGFVIPETGPGIAVLLNEPEFASH